jgi:hypothetical protein
LTLQVVSFANVYFSSIIYFDLDELTCHLLPPQSYMNHKPHAMPSSGFNLKPIKRCWAIDHTNGEFCDFYFVNYLIENDHP